MNGFNAFRNADARIFLYAATALGLLSIPHATSAANPIVKTAYSADPSGHVFGGRLYVYATHDQTDAREYDTIDYHVYSTDDLQNWNDHGVVLSLAQIPWAKAHLWAPDCNEKDGVYYLYFPADFTGKYNFKIGVATSKSPAGPFVAEPEPIAGADGIDPSIYIDDDGTPYLIWAEGGPKICKLKPDMKTLDGDPVSLTGCDKFFEGPWIFKRNGTYYLTYPAFQKGGSGQGGNGENYDYATAPAIMGPYTYHGSFTRSLASQKLCGNIHGSQFAYHGKWYCLYHDCFLSNGLPTSGFRRCVDLDEMRFNPDGTIQPLVWTRTGPPALKDLNPYVRCEAECMNDCDAPEGPLGIETEACGEDGVDVDGIRNGAWIKYANVDFAAGARGFQARVATPIDGCSIELHLDGLTGPEIGVCSVANTGGRQTWRTIGCPVTHAKGVHDLYFRCVGPGSTGLFNIDWYRFIRSKRK